MGGVLKRVDLLQTWLRVVRHIVDSDRIERSLAHMALRPVSTSIRTIPVLVLVLRCT